MKHIKSIAKKVVDESTKINDYALGNFLVGMSKVSTGVLNGNDWGYVEFGCGKMIITLPSGVEFIGNILEECLEEWLHRSESAYF